MQSMKANIANKIKIVIKPFDENIVECTLQNGRLRKQLCSKFKIMPSVRSIFAAPAKFTRTAFVCLFVMSFPGCKSGQTIYKSSCDPGVDFKKVGFTQLINNIQKYDRQYVEVKGVYR